jgi:hypothetical protein
MPTTTNDAPSEEGTALTGETSPDSGIWARSRTAPARPQDSPLSDLDERAQLARLATRLSAWISWCATLVFCLALVAIVFGTLLQLTRELVALGHHDGSPAYTLADEH